ncbi:hypothetical protein AB4525_08865 [Vibrio breoganii]
MSPKDFFFMIVTACISAFLGFWIGFFGGGVINEYTDGDFFLFAGIGLGVTSCYMIFMYLKKITGWQVADTSS